MNLFSLFSKKELNKINIIPVQPMVWARNKSINPLSEWCKAKSGDGTILRMDNVNIYSADSEYIRTNEGLRISHITHAYWFDGECYSVLGREVIRGIQKYYQKNISGYREKLYFILEFHGELKSKQNPAHHKISSWIRTIYNLFMTMSDSGMDEKEYVDIIDTKHITPLYEFTKQCIHDQELEDEKLRKIEDEIKLKMKEKLKEELSKLADHEAIGHLSYYDEVLKQSD
jgi:hypothetical protein